MAEKKDQKSGLNEHIDRALNTLGREITLDRKSRNELSKLLRSYLENLPIKENYQYRQEDIAKRIKEEQNLKILNAISGQADFAFFLKDSHGKYIFVNKEWKRLFGLEESDVLGKTVFNLLDKSIATVLNMQDEEVLYQDRKVTVEKWIKTTRNERYYSINKFPVKNIPGLE